MVERKPGNPTIGNGPSPSLVEELEGYDEEGIGSAQHRFKRQELLEGDQPVIEGVFSVEEKIKQKKAPLNMYFYSTLTERLPPVQTKPPGFFPDSRQERVVIIQMWSDPIEMMPKSVASATLY